jgi:hypothetical protein
MKHTKQRRVYALLFALAGAALLIGCKPAAVGVSGMAGLNCANCHSSSATSTYGLQVIANEAAYNNSGHLNGPRVFNTNVQFGLQMALQTSNDIYQFTGSHAPTENSASCSQCHTDQGFVTLLTTGVAGAQATASPPGCFTCHDPHDTGNFSLRTQGAVSLIDGTTYNYGAGNLCANCHHARDSSNLINTITTWPSTSLNRDFPAMGVQSDFMLGRTAWEFAGNTYAGTSPHATATADSCVSCHKFVNTGGNTASGSPQLGGHAFYQAAQVGTPALATGGETYSETDQVTLCQSCHAGTGKTFPTYYTAPADWAGIGAGKDVLVEIRALRDMLLAYFYTQSVVTIPAGSWWTGPALAPASYPAPWNTPATTETLEWNRDFVVNSGASVTQVQAEALWNLSLFLYDRSNGIHNPIFAAQILYDSCVAVGITGLGPRPQ